MVRESVLTPSQNPFDDLLWSSNQPIRQRPKMKRSNATQYKGALSWCMLWSEGREVLKAFVFFNKLHVFITAAMYFLHGMQTLTFIPCKSQIWAEVFSAAFVSVEWRDGTCSVKCSCCVFRAKAAVKVHTATRVSCRKWLTFIESLN